MSLPMFRTVNARKDHRCDLCGWPIPKGDPYKTWTLTPSMSGSGYWVTGHTHVICHAVYNASDWWRDDDELPDPSDFRSELLAFAVSASGNQIVFEEEQT